MNKMKSENGIKIILALAYLFLMVGGVLNIPISQAFGCMIILLAILFSPIVKGLLYSMAMVPNIAAYSVADVGLNYLGVSFLIILLKMAGSGNKWRLRITALWILVAGYLLSLSAFRLLSGNFYDFAVISQVLIVVLAWLSIIKHISVDDSIKVIYFFRYGCILMLFGMIFQNLFDFESIGRFKAVNDDANYTGGVCCALLTIELLVYCYRLPLKHNYRYLLFAVFAGLMTGSRGFILSSSVALFILLITKSFGKQTSKFVFSLLVLLALFYVLYLAGFGPAVTVYSNTIDRTIDLQESYTEGNFMDVTSGRMTLWAYYMVMATNNMNVFYFGRGFYNYFLVENGGFGLAAHNMYVSSIVGIGVIGTILLLFLYFSIIRSDNLHLKKKHVLSFSSLVVSIMVCYFFLDGTLETRLITYFAITALLMKVYFLRKNCFKN